MQGMIKRHRKSIRLKNYDYSKEGAYFVTIRISDNSVGFGIVQNGGMILNSLGNKVYEYWENIPSHSRNTILDEFVIMPDHIHGIIVICHEQVDLKNKNLNTRCSQSNLSKGIDRIVQKSKYHSQISPTKDSLGTIIRTLKSGFSSWCHKNGIPSFRWHRNYFDRIIRNEKELQLIQRYIFYNPLQWEMDMISDMDSDFVNSLEKT